MCLLEVSGEQGWFAGSRDVVSMRVEAGLVLGLAVPGCLRASRANHGCSYLSVHVLPGPNCALDVTNAGGWPSHEGSAGVNDGLAATAACNLLAVHDDAGGGDRQSTGPLNNQLDLSDVFKLFF